MSAALANHYDELELQQKEQELLLSKACLSRFTYAISHELNAPVTTLTHLLEIFAEENRLSLDHENRELLDMILVSATRSKEMVDGILDYSKSTLPLGKKEDVDTRLLLDDVVAQLDDLVQTSNAIVDIGEMPVINTSAHALKQVFQQIIANALKFAKADDTQATLFIEAKTESQGVEFKFTDEGPGIDPVQHEKVFDLFSRLHARSEFDGAGLGLPISLQIVNSLDGRIWITQAPTGGAAFHVFLPAKPLSRPAANDR